MGKWQTSTPTTTTKISASPALFTANWDALQEWSAVEHYGLTESLSGRHKPGASLWYANTTAEIGALAAPTACAAAIDITLNSLKYYSGSAWVDLGGAVPSGTKMLFYNETAPTGWTVVTTSTVTGTTVIITQGGAGLGGTAHATGTWTITSHTHTSPGHALTIAEMPTHVHTKSAMGSYLYLWSNAIDGGVAPYASTGNVITVNLTSQGGGAAHTSTYSSETDPSGGATWRPAALCCLLCQKD